MPQVRTLRWTTMALAVTAVTATATLPDGSASAVAEGSSPTSAARPHSRLPAVRNLVAVPVGDHGGYRVNAGWDALAGATSYAVRMTDQSGAVLASGTVTGTSWSAVTTLAAHSKVTVAVTGLAVRHRGVKATVTVELRDVTAPEAAYTVLRTKGSETDGNIQLRIDVLSDDVSDAEHITQTVTWDDGTPPQDWPSSAQTLAHAYGDAPHVYHPVVTVGDEAGNSRPVELAVAVSDAQTPTGSFTAAPTAGFARWTVVSLAGTATDDLSDPAGITRLVDWGDGSSQLSWVTGTAARHVYDTGGDFTPEVTLVDEAGHRSEPVPADTVSIAVDDQSPVVRVSRPAAPRRVASWRAVRGTARDAGVGVRQVRLQAVEKRAGAWYAYRPAKGRWVEAGPTRASAVRKAGTARFRARADGTWTRRLKGLTRGTLLVRTSGTDRLGNSAPWSVTRQRLSRR